MYILLEYCITSSTALLTAELHRALHPTGLPLEMLPKLGFLSLGMKIKLDTSSGKQSAKNTALPLWTLNQEIPTLKYTIECPYFRKIF